MNWKVVIGIEVHVRLNTKSKLFSAASATYGASPNAQACLIDLAMPGTLPVLNDKAIDMAIQFGLATNCQIHPYNVFARKNYFYPDLPKGYQISQLNHPIVSNGELMIEVDGTPKTVRINRAHLEEDAGKSIHHCHHTALDFNRAGTALIEVVTEPEIYSTAEAIAYLKALYQTVTYLGICDGNMEQGSFKCDINISLRANDQAPLGTRTEIKNLNSFRFIERAIDYEIQRQSDLLDRGKAVIQCTRLFDPDNNETRLMRTKEEAHDYRYFPEPDLLPVHISQARIDLIRATMPEASQEKEMRFIKQFQLKNEFAKRLSQKPHLGILFDQAAQQQDAYATDFANWILGDISALLSTHHISPVDCPIKPNHLTDIATALSSKRIAKSAVKIILTEIFNHASTVDQIITIKQLEAVSDTATLTTLVQDILDQNSNQVNQYRQGKEKLWGFFMGKIMKQTKGKADPDLIKNILKEKLQ